MAIVSATFRIRVAWWLPLYLNSVALFAWLMDAEPDWDKVEVMIIRGLKVVA